MVACYASGFAVYYRRVSELSVYCTTRYYIRNVQYRAIAHLLNLEPTVMLCRSIRRSTRSSSSRAPSQQPSYGAYCSYIQSPTGIL